jgi:hypothetical protein
MNESNNVLLSIVIPTRNRSVYLKRLLSGLLSSARSDFEVVVQDNSDDDSLSEYVVSLDDTRVRYFYLPERVSVVRNSDLAVGAAGGDYVCMLGDDDGLLLDESLELLAAARSSDIDAVIPEAYYYTWPSLVHKTWGQIGGRLFEKSFSGKVRSIDANRERRSVLAAGAAFGLYLMPRVYQAFVSRKTLSSLRAVAGTCFPGPSPDMANALALTRFAANVLYVDFPYVIMGHSGGSGGGMGAAKVHRGDIRQQTHLPPDTADNWNPAIPFFWSGPTIYAQSAYQAISTVWPKTEFPVLNYSTLYATCFVYEPQFWRTTFSAMRASKEPMVGLIMRTAASCLAILARRSRSFVRNLALNSSKREPAEAVEDICVAIRVARARIAASGLHPSLVRN